MGPGINELKKMHEQWSENKEVNTPKTNQNIGKNILKDIISGSDKNTHVINSRNGGGTILKGVWVSYRGNGKKTNIHKVTMYHDVLKKAGLSRGDIVSPVITDDGNYLAIILSSLLGTKAGYKLSNKTKNCFSARIEFTSKQLKFIDKRFSIDDIEIIDKAILIPWGI